MLFEQLTARDSLRELLISLESHRDTYYYLGLGKDITRSNLSKTNEKRNCLIFEDFAYYMIEQAKQGCVNDEDFKLNLKGNVYALDSTTIVLWLSVFWWVSSEDQKEV